MADNSQKDPHLWVDEYGDILYRYAIARVRDPNVAEDLVQDTFLAGIKGRDKFSGRSTERTWLVGILKHKIIDHYRKSKREISSEDLEVRDVPEEQYFDRKGTWKVSPNEWLTDPSKAFEQKEFFGILHSCMQKLPKKQLIAFEMRELQGASPEEICKAIDVTSTNLWVIIYRARAQLKKCIELNWLNQAPSES